jgi:hypothetical protein
MGPGHCMSLKAAKFKEPRVSDCLSLRSIAVAAVKGCRAQQAHPVTLFAIGLGSQYPRPTREL